MSTSILRRRPFAGVVAAGMAALCLAASASAAQAQTLVGEKFESAEHIEALGWQGECNPTGTSTFTFGTFGEGTGPVPGQFEEYGIVTIDGAAGRVTAYDSQYTLSEGETTWITGTRSLTESISASCTDGENGLDTFAVELVAGYDVDEPFTESGPSTVKINAGVSPSGFTALFGAQSPPPPAQPQSKDDCRNGGWKAYGFKNQGACIAFVVNGKRP